eukprot:scaffold4924_cov127-Skeletonema_marinoi.AAC.3
MGIPTVGHQPCDGRLVNENARAKERSVIQPTYPRPALFSENTSQDEHWEKPRRQHAIMQNR